MVSAFYKVKKMIDTACRIVFSVTIVPLVLLTFVGVIMRYVLNAPINWVEEIQMILVVWMAFWGVGTAFAEHGNISIDLLVERFPRSLRQAAAGFSWAITTIVLFIMMRLAFTRFSKLYGSLQLTPVLKIPRSVQYSLVAVACVFILLSHICTGISDLIERKHREKEKSAS